MAIALTALVLVLALSVHPQPFISAIQATARH